MCEQGKESIYRSVQLMFEFMDGPPGLFAQLAESVNYLEDSKRG